ncbi:MAG TPA: hypothetical protein VF429_07205, partial [Anaerolineae bacterium]
MTQAASFLPRSNVLVPRVISPTVQLLRRVARNVPALLGALVIIGMVVVALFAPFIAPYPYDQTNL